MNATKTTDDVNQLWHASFAKRVAMSGRSYRHKKTGNVYYVTGFCLREADAAVCVLYRREDEAAGVIWCRPLTEFDDRFERIGK